MKNIAITPRFNNPIFRKAVGFLVRKKILSLKDFGWKPDLFIKGIPTNFSIHAAVALPAIGAAVELISWSVAELPIKIYNVRKDGTKELVPADDPEYVAITGKWGDLTSVEGVQHFISSILEVGKGGIQVERDSFNRVTSLVPIDATCLDRRREGGKIIYKARINGKEINLDREDLIYLPFRQPRDLVSDKSPLETYWHSIRAALAATYFSAWYFDRGATPSTIYTNEKGQLSKDQAVIATKAIHAVEDDMRHKNRRSMVLPGGYKANQLGGNPNDSDLSNQRTFGVQVSGRIYSIPPMLLQDLSRGTYSNFAQAAHFVGKTITRWSRRVSTEFSYTIWPGGTKVCEFDVSNLKLESMLDRFKAYEIGIRNGFMRQIDAIRAEGGEDTSEIIADNPGIDKYIRNSSVSVNVTEGVEV